MNYVEFLTGNHILNVAIVSWFTAQCLKVIITLITKKKFNIRRFIGAGGMPSSHTAFTFSLATAVGMACGFYSVEFAITAALAAIVTCDASGVRRAAGEQAKILNYMMDHWEETTPEIFQKNLKELLGHTPVEVFFGALLGIFIAVIW